MSLIARRGFVASCLGLAAAMACSSAAFAGGASESDRASLEAAITGHTDRLIVKYKPGTLAAARADAQTMSVAFEAAARAGVQLKHLRTNALGGHVMKMDKLLAIAEVRALAKAVADADSDVEFAEPDRRMHALMTPNDTSYNSQWHYFETTGGLRAPAAWDKSTGSGIKVAVIDTGYRPHVDLAANIVGGYDFIADTWTANDGGGRDSSAQDPGDWVSANACGGSHAAQNSSWHGTHVAGTVAAVTNNASGVAGVAFNAKVVPARVLGRCGGYTSDIADAITWTSGGSVSGVPANTNAARVINLSLGGGGSCDSTTQGAINGARSRGTVLVVAAGNSNANASGFTPANCSGVITVAATGRTGARAYYSNYGSVVDVAAPGGDMSGGSSNGILSTLNAGTSTPGADNYAYYQGTSMAAPHVAGVVALMLAKNGALTPDEVETKLKGSTRAFPGNCSQCGTGIVDANAAVDAAAGGGGGGSNVAEVESNNTRATAQSITVNPATVSGTMGTSSDTDYFKVTIGTGKTLTSTLTPNGSSDYDLYLYNASGTLLASSELGTGQVDSIVRTNTGAATTWYVRVYYYSGLTGSGGTYTLGLSQ